MWELDISFFLLWDDKISTDNGNVNLYPSKASHWVLTINQYSFYSHSFRRPAIQFENKQEKNGYSEYRSQKKIVSAEIIVFMSSNFLFTSVAKTQFQNYLIEYSILL